ncbi:MULTISPECIES: spore coat protein [Priestia]|uniref:spore coat protein n=1 Tax=Priestia TaxID=2800373 RepID=UPI00040D150A|nr:spore coat protein [Priestia megaterium]RFB33579.1 spore coat protein X [Bacillus sp. RC]MBV6738249.1 spore coat protein [Priestia megaterium]MBW0933419.1 spore coat protein [Priestia megaterium]MCU7766676.1 spore coat protein [Priestia megaterium]MDC7783683.1 spore coat protein [Priestia megaterium]
MPTHKRYESREVKKRSKKKHSDHDHKSRFELEEDDHFSHLFESDNHFEDESKEDAVIEQEPDAFSFVDQESTELIWIKDSCDIEVTTTDTQVAVQLQVAIQVALGVVISILSANVANSEVIAQDLLAHANLEQTNKQKIVIVNSKDVKITTTDVDAAVNIQVAVQALIAVFVSVLSS